MLLCETGSAKSAEDVNVNVPKPIERQISAFAYHTNRFTV